MLDAVAVGQVVPFDQFNIETTFDRVVVPVQSGPVFKEEWQIYWDPIYDAPRIVNDMLTFITLERTPDGWRRIK